MRQLTKSSSGIGESEKVDPNRSRRGIRGEWPSPKRRQRVLLLRKYWPFCGAPALRPSTGRRRKLVVDKFGSADIGEFGRSLQRQKTVSLILSGPTGVLQQQTPLNSRFS